MQKDRKAVVGALIGSIIAIAILTSGVIFYVFPIGCI
jgi:uncharacterized membrane protein